MDAGREATGQNTRSNQESTDAFWDENSAGNQGSSARKSHSGAAHKALRYADDDGGDDHDDYGSATSPHNRAHDMHAPRTHSIRSPATGHRSTSRASRKSVGFADSHDDEDAELWHEKSPPKRRSSLSGGKKDKNKKTGVGFAGAEEIVLEDADDDQNDDEVSFLHGRCRMVCVCLYICILV
jgi:hypothetical protein